MTTIADMREISPALTLTQQPAAFSFEVKGVEKLATKVNGAAQYVFQVQFKSAVTEESEKPIVAIPLHSMSMTKALMMLEAMGRTFQSMGSKELNHAVEHLGYSAVTIEREKLSSNEIGYHIEFDRYDEKADRFASSPHITETINAKTAAQLEGYARQLEKEYIKPEDQPQVELNQTESQPKDSYPVTSIELERRDSIAENPQEKITDIELLHQGIHTLCLRNTPGEVSEEEWEKKVKPYDTIFGDGFMEEVKTKAQSTASDDEEPSLEDLLTRVAWEKAQDLLAEEEKKAMKAKLPNDSSTIEVRDFIMIVNAVNDSQCSQE